MKYLIYFCLVILCFGSEKTFSFGGKGIECSDSLSFKFGLDEIIIKDIDDSLVSLEIPNKPIRLQKGEPDLPVLREFIALPQLGDWKVVVEDVVTVNHDLKGKMVIPSKGELLIREDPNDVPLEFGDSYSFPSNLSTVLLHPQHTMRDVFGTILEINPINYNPTNGMLKIVVSCTIKVISSKDDTLVIRPKIVDPTFYDLYNFHYLNFHHYAGTWFVKGDDLGRMIIFYDSQFKESAAKFAKWKKDLLKDVLLAPCSGSADSLKSQVKTHFNEADSLTYVLLLGRSCPTFQCQVSRRECDVQYAQLSSDADDMTLDVFVSRIAATSQSEVDAIFAKFQSYSSFNTSNDWQHETAGLALDLMGDEYKYMHRNLDKMKDFGFTKSTFMQDNTATSSQVYDDWNNGMGIYFYIGHGSGTAWNCPQHTGGFPESAIHSRIHNANKYPFVLECSCLNGGFKNENPCFAQAMIAEPKGGAISMYSSAPEATSSSPKDLQSGAVDALTSKAATRVGPIYYAGIMYAYKLHPSQCKYTLQGYNMFGDPSIQLNFLK